MSGLLSSSSSSSSSSLLTTKNSSTTKKVFLLSYFLLFLLSLLSLSKDKQVLAYTSSSSQRYHRSFGVTTPAPHHNNINLQPSTTTRPSQSFATFSSSITKKNKKKQSYDLGIGKNKPVVYGKFNKSQKISNNPTKFLIEYESTREFPSPLNQNTEMTESLSSKMIEADATGSSTTPMMTKNEATSSKSKKKKLLPTVQLKRRTMDALNIVQNKDKNGILPLAFIALPENMAQPQPELDINTVWVEMMIYNQQHLATAVANACCS